MLAALLFAFALGTAVQAQTSFSTSITSTVNVVPSTDSKTSSTPSTTVITGFFGAPSGVFASVVSAAPCATTMIIDCNNPLCRNAEDIPLTYIESSAAVQIAYMTTIGGQSVTIREYCTWQGPKSAPTLEVCSASGVVNSGGFSTTTTVLSTVTDTASITGLITVTAGAEKLAAATGSCTVSASVAPLSEGLNSPIPSISVDPGSFSGSIAGGSGGSNGGANPASSAKPTGSGAVRMTGSVYSTLLAALTAMTAFIVMLVL